MLLAEALRRRQEVGRLRRAPIRIGRARQVRQVLGDGIGVRGEFVLVPVEEVGHPHQQLRPRHLALSAVFGREVGAAEEGTSVGEAEAIEGPATVSVDHLDGVHHEFIDLGAFFPVDLDADEVLVHQLRDVRLLEGLAGHDVAPVAGRVADRDEHRLALGLGRGKGLRTPRPPMDGVSRMLFQVEGLLLGQTIGHPRKVAALWPGATLEVLACSSCRRRGRA